LHVVEYGGWCVQGGGSGLRLMPMVVPVRCQFRSRWSRGSQVGPGDGTDPRRSRSARRKGAEPAKGTSQQFRPGPGTLQAQDHPPAAAGHASGDMKQPVAEPPGLPAPGLSVQALPLEEGEQILGREHQLQPDLVGGELVEEEVPQPGVLAAADALLDVGTGAMTGLELGQVVALLVGDEDLEAKPLVVGEGELSGRVRTFAPADGPGPGRPAKRGPGSSTRRRRRLRAPRRPG
jgi:hypothetical protein